MTRLLWSGSAALVLAASALVAACGSSSGGSRFNGGTGEDGGNGGGVTDGGFLGDSTVAPPPLLPDDGGAFNSEAGALTISPSAPTVTVTLGATPSMTPLQFSATYKGATVGAQWTIDRGELGTIGVGTGLFTPATLGGVATITATYQGSTVTTPLTVKIVYVGYGDPNAPDAGAGGAGGVGGVGGSGEGPGATSGQITALNGTPTADPALLFLYPYDKTVFPQAVLPPLLQWTLGSHTSIAAALIHISETNYDYKGYFQPPATPFQNQPVPQAIWNAVAYSNSGENVSVQVTLLDSAGALWGPISESWIIAPGTLKGTIYYNSYGTNLAHNLCCAIGADGTDDGAKFGGATLAIKEGATDPVLIAGNDSECRVCHAVSAGGSTLITQQGSSYSTSSTYALTNSNLETVVPNNNGDGRFTYPAISPDGTLLFTHETASALYDINGTAITGVTGIPSKLSAFTPAFSPDGTHIAYNFAGGTGSDGASIASIDFAKATNAFSNAQLLYTPPSGEHAYWPSYLPTNAGIVFDVETVYNGRDTAGTRSQCDTPSSGQGGDGGLQPENPCHSEGSHAEIWWVDVASKIATRLDNLNGKGYLPPHASYTGTNGDDSTLNYEPTVNPVPSGGYAWVVFTSRRLYGNVATINPYWSDPRFENISSTPTTKKLWVAAIDLNAKPGTDPSHPAFYLPAQELLAGNSRGFWVVDPCQQDGTSCVTGDECCGGYCRPGEDGGLMCTATQPSCSQEYEKCSTSADCCGVNQGIQCIDGLCSQTGPK
jgi:hypothetical protein